MLTKKQILVICGPTASGKTDLAHKIALHYTGEIINIDVMQLYSNIKTLTASPSKELKKELPYHLYNFLNLNTRFSVVQYIKLAIEKIKNISTIGRLPILVGGSGMYINSLLYGYSDMPSITEEILNYSIELHNKIGQQEFFQLLQSTDPLAATKLNNNDSQRSIRSYSVFLQTGKSIVEFQQTKNNYLQEFNIEIMCLNPERNFLYNTCNTRLEKIFKQGGIEEISNQIEIFNHKQNTIKPIGYLEIIDYLNNRMTLLQAIEKAQAKTRQYAKRQVTWFKNQMTQKNVITYSDIKEFNQLLNKYS